jgi:NADH-quinone oxidoreductase subunit N
MTPITLPAGDLRAIAPEIVLTLGGCLLMLCGAFFGRSRRTWPILSLLVVAAAWFVQPAAAETRSVFFGALEIGRLSRFIDLVVYVATALVLLVGGAYYERDREGRAEVYALILWTALGLSVMAKSLDLLVLFLGLELASICMYVLAGWYRNVAASDEAALKYFLTSSFASAILLYGIAFLYGKSGSTSIPGLLEVIGKTSGVDPLLSIGFFLVIVGTAFKLGVVPFHGWVPDVYQGAPTPAAALIAVAPKAAAFVVLARVVTAIDAVHATGRWSGLLAILAVLSIVVGNLSALAQRDVKRMLAYSGIAHMGYVLIGFVALGNEGLAGVLTYALAYVFANVGAFAVSAAVTRGEDQPHPVSDLAGLSKTRPFAAFAMTIFMISLAGVPPTAGFLGKFLVFGAAVSAGWTWLALVGIAGSLVSAGYYLRVVHTMYVRDVPVDPPRTEPDWMGSLALATACAGVLALGVFAGPVTRATLDAAQTLFGH